MGSKCLPPAGMDNALDVLDVSNSLNKYVLLELYAAVPHTAVLVVMAFVRVELTTSTNRERISCLCSCSFCVPSSQKNKY